jgi:hypothetical protein
MNGAAGEPIVPRCGREGAAFSLAMREFASSGGVAPADGAVGRGVMEFAARRRRVVTGGRVYSDRSSG